MTAKYMDVMKEAAKANELINKTISENPFGVKISVDIKDGIAMAKVAWMSGSPATPQEAASFAQAVSIAALSAAGFAYNGCEIDY